MPSLSLGQTIRGVVVERDDTARVPGVVMVLVDTSGNAVARTLSNEQGEYRLAAPVAGTYRVRTLRIGFRPGLSRPFELRERQEFEHTLALTGVAISLDTIRVQARNVCRAYSDSTAIIAVWEQARTALTAAQLTARTRAISASTLRYRRSIDPSSRRTLQQSYSFESSFVISPWRSISTDSLRRFGYVQASADGWTTYHAPDLDVLLSNEFVEDHCFHLASGTDQSVIGIAFEPRRDRSGTPDIRGTLWLDRKTSELRRMDFRYANIARAYERADAGGDMDFVRIGNGAWAIARWDIRMPVLEQRKRKNDGVPGSAPTVEHRLTELRISGGKLALVTHGRDTLWAHPRMALAGTVVDSISGSPIPNARVTLPSIGLQGVTGEDGQFAIAGLVPGRYTLEVRTAALDSVGGVHRVLLTLGDPSDAFRIRLAPTVR